MPGHVPRTTFGDENHRGGGLPTMTPGSIHEGVSTLDGIDDLTHAEGLSQGAVEPLMTKLGDLSVRELLTHADDLRDLEIITRPENLADIAAFTVGDMNIKQHDVRPETFALHTGFKGAGRRMDFVVGLLGENLGEGVDDILITIHDQDAGAPTHEPVHRDAVTLHELDEIADGYAPVLGTGYAIPPQLAGIEPFAHGSRRDIADFRYLSGSQYIFLEKIHAIPRI